MRIGIGSNPLWVLGSSGDLIVVDLPTVALLLPPSAPPTPGSRQDSGCAYQGCRRRYANINGLPVGIWFMCLILACMQYVYKLVYRGFAPLGEVTSPKPPRPVYITRGPLVRSGLVMFHRW